MSIIRTVSCTCDTCGKRKRCPPAAKGPQGWFFVDITDPDGGGDLVTVLACSLKCRRDFGWAKVPRATTRKS